MPLRRSAGGIASVTSGARSLRVIAISEPEIDERRDPFRSERVDRGEDDPGHRAQSPIRHAGESNANPLERSRWQELPGHAERDQCKHGRLRLLHRLVPAAAEPPYKNARDDEILRTKEDPRETDEMKHDQP